MKKKFVNVILSGMMALSMFAGSVPVISYAADDTVITATSESDAMGDAKSSTIEVTAEGRPVYVVSLPATVDLELGFLPKEIAGTAEDVFGYWGCFNVNMAGFISDNHYLDIAIYDTALESIAKNKDGVNPAGKDYAKVWGNTGNYIKYEWSPLGFTTYRISKESTKAGTIGTCDYDGISIKNIHYGPLFGSVSGLDGGDPGVWYGAEYNENLLAGRYTGNLTVNFALGFDYNP